MSYILSLLQSEQGQKIKDIYHKCAFCLDLFTGNVYLDCRKRKIWAKCAALTINTPLIGLTLYDQNPTLKGFNNLARSNVKFKRRGYNIFNDCCLKLDPHKPYVSAAYDPAWQIPV